MRTRKPQEAYLLVVSATPDDITLASGQGPYSLIFLQSGFLRKPIQSHRQAEGVVRGVQEEMTGRSRYFSERSWAFVTLQAEDHILLVETTEVLVLTIPLQ